MRELKIAGTGFASSGLYARVSTLVLFVLGLVHSDHYDRWLDHRPLLRRAEGGSLAANAWRDPVFGNPLPFYFFELPFYSLLVGYLRRSRLRHRSRLLGCCARLDAAQGSAAHARGPIPIQHLELPAARRSRALASSCSGGSRAHRLAAAGVSSAIRLSGRRPRLHGRRRLREHQHRYSSAMGIGRGVSS